MDVIKIETKEVGYVVKKRSDTKKIFFKSTNRQFISSTE